MKLLLESKGLKSHIGDEEESTLYFNESMLENNVLIYENTIMNEKDDFECYISIKHYNDVDALEHHIYWGESLSYIQMARIILDVVDIYNSNSLKDFLKIIDDLSSGGVSSSMQSDTKHKIDVTNRIKQDFKNIRMGV